MPIEKEKLENLLRLRFPTARIEVQALAADDDHYAVMVRCEAFAGKSLILQHRMVQDAVKGQDIHAMSIRTGLPE